MPRRSEIADLEGEFEDVYRRHAPGAFRRARRILGHEADAHEVVHDVFLSLLERPHQYRGESSLSSFLYSATTHACLNLLRNRRRRLSLLRDRWLELVQDTPSRPPAEAATTLHSALRRMPPPLAEVAVYYHLDGLTHQEIAHVVGCSRRQVGNHLEHIERWASREALRACRI